MLKKFFLSCSALITTCALAVGQVAPIDCSCSLVADFSFVQNNQIGSITVTGTCTPNPSGLCSVSGTVTFVYNPAPGITFVAAEWREPSTAVTLPVGTSVFSPNFTRECTGKNAFIGGWVRVTDGAGFLFLSAYKQFFCFGAL